MLALRGLLPSEVGGVVARLCEGEVAHGGRAISAHIEFHLLALTLAHTGLRGHCLGSVVALGQGQRVRGRLAGLATSLCVSGLKPSTVYSYSVVGHNADLESRESNRVQVTLKSSGVESNLVQGYACTVTGRTLRLTVPTDAQVTVVDVAGRTVASCRQSAGTAAYQLPAAGIHIVRAAQATFKVAVR